MLIDTRNLKDLDPTFRRKVERILTDMEEYLGYRAYVASGRRTPAEQAKKLAAGTSRKKHSKHLTGKAADIVPAGIVKPWENAPRGFWLRLGYLAYKYGLRWGGEFGVPKGPLLDKLRADIKAKRWNTRAKLGWDPAHVEMRT